jgi:sugar phosphate isomerase/epimerase
MFKLGVLTDEIGQDLEQALNVMKDLGLDYVELQSLWGRDVAKLGQEEIEKAKRMIVEREMKVSCIASRLFLNVPLRAERDAKSYWGSYLEHMEDMRRSIDIAKKLETKIVRTFSFQTESLLEPALFGETWALLLDMFNEPIKLAEREDIILAVETCMFSNTGSCALARRLIDDLGSRNVKVLWDIANCLYLCEKPFPDGYELIKDDIVHIHAKDGVVNLPKLTFNFCELGKGQVKTYPEIVRALQKNGYDGVVSFECEYVPDGGTKADAVRKSVAYLKSLIR